MTVVVFAAGAALITARSQEASDTAENTSAAPTTSITTTTAAQLSSSASTSPGPADDRPTGPAGDYFPVCGTTLDHPAPLVLTLTVGASQQVTLTADNRSGTSEITFNPDGIPYLVDEAGVVIASPGQIYAGVSPPITIPAGGHKTVKLLSYDRIGRCGSVGDGAPNGRPLSAGNYRLGEIFTTPSGSAITAEYLAVTIDATGTILPSP